MPLRLPKDRVNDYILHKQHLAPRSRSRDLLSVVRQVGPIRARPTIIAYVALWSRMAAFRLETLDSALYEERTLARFPCIHSQLHIMPSDELPAYFQTTSAGVLRGLDSFVDDLIAQVTLDTNQSRLDSGELVQRVLEVVSTRGPCTLSELSELLPTLNRLIPHDPEDPRSGCAKLGARLIPALCAQGLLIRARPRGSWRSELYTYASLSSWLPQVDLASLGPESALQCVVFNYVSAFGPVTVGDVSHWIGDLKRWQIVGALMALRRKLTRLEISGAPGQYFMLKDQVDELLDYSRDERTVCLLPPRDSYVMAYSRTSRFLPSEFRERVFDRAGEALGTIWVDGCAVGVWWLQIKEERILARLFEPLDPEAMVLVAEEAQRLGRFLGFSSQDIGIGLYPDDDAQEESTATTTSIGYP